MCNGEKTSRAEGNWGEKGEKQEPRRDSNITSLAIVLGSLCCPRPSIPTTLTCPQVAAALFTHHNAAQAPWEMNLQTFCTSKFPPLGTNRKPALKRQKAAFISELYGVSKGAEG